MSYARMTVGVFVARLSAQRRKQEREFEEFAYKQHGPKQWTEAQWQAILQAWFEAQP